ncbi:glutamine ABC transporter substrate-binding protein GlnH [Acidocella sp.]|uniref:glutamine ABC transporter substrate-binding protein GlnH n=1 Tax=Acidocella sp. TaxID=50710 RepID=UPI0017E2F9A2|nr:glutamine ABC transporter substrate-binding protein GlnH [Acidocella sp.]NNM56685.1 glutamine ABC transporter substrate-binding protein GlnH [Acidocella sp.]
MRRRLLLGIFTAALALTGSAKASFAEGKVLTVGTDVSFMPFEFSNNGKTQGFDIDLWTKIASDLGLKFKWQPMDFSGIIPALQTKNIDVAISGITITPARAQVIDFSEPYYASGLTAVVAKNDTAITSPADLAGKKIGVKTGTATVDWVKANVKNAQMVSFPNIDDALLALQAGRVDAVIHDTPNVVYYANTAGKGLVRVLTPPMESGEYYGIAFPKGSPLVPQINAELSKLSADGFYKATYIKWFGMQPAFEPK